jgi:hypothetical protein
LNILDKNREIYSKDCRWSVPLICSFIRLGDLLDYQTKTLIGKILVIFFFLLFKCWTWEPTFTRLNVLGLGSFEGRADFSIQDMGNIGLCHLELCCNMQGKMIWRSGIL